MKPLLSLLWIVLSAAITFGQTKSPLPKVVLVGDSIRMGYAPLVAKKLMGQVEIISPTTNGGDSGNVLKNLDEWIIQVQPTLVHFNCGLHDLKKNRKSNQYQVSLENYEANLKVILQRLKKETKAQIVFASTTPILDDRHAKRKGDFDRLEADVKKYNEIASKVMIQNQIPIHDLHRLVHHYGDKKLLGNDGTHYTKEGNEILADAVVDCIRRQLAILHAPPSRTPIQGKDAADPYRVNEKAWDDAVPKFFKEIKAPEFPVPKDQANWENQRPQVKEKVLASLGDLPPRPKQPKIRVISFEQRWGFKLEKFLIDNESGNDISCLLILPDDVKKPAPGILWLHSSGRDQNDLLTPNRNGGEEPLGIVLAKKGYVVLGLDNWWHGDRSGTGPGGNKEKQNEEQQSLHKLQLWLGRTLWGMFVRDDQIALDYLCSRPEVDAKRIGATGMSMGSTRAWWLAAIDDRIACTVGVACLTRYTNLIAHGQLRQHGVYYYVNGLLKHFDTEGVLSLIAPRPYLALTGDLDAGSPADGIRIIEEKVSGIYAALNAKDRYKNILYSNIGHTHTSEMREETLKWFDRWLKP
jgi:lysophospholipase L1-like esterase